MFTGIIEEIGRVRSVKREAGRVRLTVEAALVLEGLRSGDSVSIDGACQTVVELAPGAFAVDSLAESLRKTTLGRLAAGGRVNLERALRADARLGGHLVQGHVSGTAGLREIRRSAGNLHLVARMPAGLLRYCAREGSIALDGVSLTIADLNGEDLIVNVIPATLERTTLGAKRPGELLNVETDLVVRGLESLLGGGARLSPERMRQSGY